jgi:ABC-type antimicrobial peptide transport system permease subunit
MFSETAPWATVVGVAKDIRSQSLQGPEPPTMFFPYAQVGKSAYFTPLQMTVAVRTDGDPAKLAPAVRQAVRQLDPNIPISDVRAMDDIVGASVASRRFTTILLGAFAGLAVVLAGIGIYGVIAYGVSQRTYEIGVRMALGAQQRAVLMLVMREGLRMAAVGLAIGIVGAIAVARVIRSLLVGVTVADPLALAAATVVLIAVAALASLVPAQRAMAVSPTEALRGS